MGQADIAQKQFFEDNERFADLLNGVLFQGDAVIRPEDLREKNAAETVTAGTERGLGKKNRAGSLEKYRDIIRKVFFGVNFCLIGVENQTKIHYAMPARTMLLDALGYEEQLREYRRRSRGGRGRTGAEYLSGFSRENRLKPSCTITIYYGEEPWDGAKNLREMLDLTDVPERLMEYFTDYPLHLVDVHRLPELEYFHTDIREVFGLIQNAFDGKRLKAYVEEHEAKFRNMREDAYEFALAATNSPELRKVKEHIITEEGRCDMCKGLRELMEGSREEGRLEGRLEGRTAGVLEGRIAGVLEGRTAGYQEGVNQIGHLVSCLLNENRIDDLKRVVSDAAYRDELLRKYSM